MKNIAAYLLSWSSSEVEFILKHLRYLSIKLISSQKMKRQKFTVAHNVLKHRQALTPNPDRNLSKVV